MHIKIKGVVLEISLLIPLVFVFLGYFFLGYFLRVIYIDRPISFRELSIFAIAALSVASIWALPQGLGGLIAVGTALILVFVKAGFVPGAIATIVAVIVTWLGVKDSNSATQQNTLSRVEWLATSIAIAITIVVTLGILGRLSGALAGVTSGLVAGAIAAIGPQIKYAELNVKQTYWLMAITVLVGLLLGGVLGIFTYGPLVRT